MAGLTVIAIFCNREIEMKLAKKPNINLLVVVSRAERLRLRFTVISCWRRARFSAASAVAPPGLQRRQMINTRCMKSSTIIHPTG